MINDTGNKDLRTGGERLPSTLQIVIYAVIHCLIYLVTNRVCFVGDWHPLYCGLDESLPLVRWFVIPYCLWFAQIAGTLIWFLITDYDSLRRYMRYVMFSTIPVYPVFILYPTCMPLRPSSLPGSDPLTLLLNFIYSVDNNTNIFPSLHVVWSVGSLLALWNDRLLSKPWAKAAAVFLTVMVCASTFMIKQHSVMDVIGAVPFILSGWFFTYRQKNRETAISE